MFKDVRFEVTENGGSAGIYKVEADRDTLTELFYACETQLMSVGLDDLSIEQLEARLEKEPDEDELKSAIRLRRVMDELTKHGCL